MSEYGFNNFDTAVIVILLLSALTAFFRGFFREILSIAGWSIASLGTVRGLPFVQPFFRNLISSSMVADFAASASLFIFIIIVWAILSGMMARTVRNSSIGGLDRFLGLIFGLVRGALLITVAYLFATFLIDKKDLPKAINEAKTTKYIDISAAFLSKFAPEGIVKGKKPEELEKEQKENQDKNEKVEDLYEKLIQPSLANVEANKNAEENKGYDEETRGELDSLIEETKKLETN